MATIIVSGAIANKCHNGGATWTRLSWVQGFRQLGCEVYFLEQLPAGVDLSSPPVDYFQSVIRNFGLEGNAGLIFGDGESFWGMTEEEVCEVARAADLLVNITGHLTWKPVLQNCRRTVYVDLDPGYTQFWHAQGSAGPRLAGHDYYFTVGGNIGTSPCSVPTNGIHWHPIRQPVVLEDWPVTERVVPGRFTTIASWRGPYGPVEADGRRYGLKVHEFRKFMELPRKCNYKFEIALDIHQSEDGDLRLLEDNGWTVLDPRSVVSNPDAFRSYVQASSAEFSVAQGIYVETNSGWFSDRTVRYLASGKPALVQDTGFSRNLPVGEGLLAFRTLDEAVAGAEAIAANYDKHARSARTIAEEFFRSDKVLGQLLERTEVSL